MRPTYALRRLSLLAALSGCSSSSATESGESQSSESQSSEAESAESSTESGGPLEPLCPDGGAEPLVQFMTIEHSGAGSGHPSFAPAGSRDVDADGLDDLIAASSERVLIAWGDFGPNETSLDGWIAAGNGFTIERTDPEGIISATIVGDVNGDGSADVVVFTERADCNCPGDDGCFGESFRRAYLVHGSAATTTIALADVEIGIGGFMLEYDEPMEYCGATELAYFAGDVDDDGMNDFIIDHGFTGALIRGTTETVAVSLTDPGPAGYLIEARMLSAAGDVDGDGIDDLVGYVGQSAQVLLGQTGVPPVPGFVVPDTDAANFPDVFGIGDFNGDGLGDIAIEDTRDQMWHVAFGRAGTATVLSSDLIAGIGGFSVAPSDGTTNRFSFGHVGDVDGDGFADLALTDRTVDGGDGSEWRSYIMYGGPEVGAPVLCDLALGIGGFGIAGTAERPVVRAYGSGLRRPAGTDVIVSSIGGVYVVSAPL
jgi:hypothetical protein